VSDVSRVPASKAIFNFVALSYLELNPLGSHSIDLTETVRVVSFELPFSRVAQSVEQVAVNHWVGGSSPSSGAIRSNAHTEFRTQILK
jgi:hypothetical protein